jgi:hypothetical protein
VDVEGVEVAISEECVAYIVVLASGIRNGSRDDG